MKRVLDVVVAMLALVALAPILLCVALASYATMGAPVIFRQVRPGLRGAPFRMYKFRTMRDPAATGTPAADRDRLTSFGKWLRSTSLDELPALVNVLKGEMSLVGPRPLLMEYLPLYSPTQFRRHEVKPGLTGWAQVHGRNLLDWEKRFELDVWYVDNRSLWLDIRILARTVVIVLTRHGVSQHGEATMRRFDGV